MAPKKEQLSTNLNIHYSLDELHSINVGCYSLPPMGRTQSGNKNRRNLICKFIFLKQYLLMWSHVPIPGPNMLPSLHLHFVLHLCNHCNKCLCIRSRAASLWFHGTVKPTFFHRSITSLFYFRCECLFAWFSDLWHSPVLMSRLSVPSPPPFSQSCYIFLYFMEISWFVKMELMFFFVWLFCSNDYRHSSLNEKW